MATRVNFNVFRYGKTVKWNFSAPVSSFNKLIRASYVFNKWCPIILKHFNITALRFIFKIEWLDAHIIFIGYRRLSRQQSLGGYFSGNMFDSSGGSIGDLEMPGAALVGDYPLYFSHIMYHPVPKSRLLIPFATPYHLPKKALEENYADRYSPIFTSSAVGNVTQLGIFNYYEVLHRLQSPFFDAAAAVARQKHWRSRKKLWARLSKIAKQGSHLVDPSSRVILNEMLKKKAIPFTKKVQILGRDPRSSDLFVYALSSFINLHNDFASLTAKLKYCSASLRQYQKLRKGYLKDIAILKEQGFKATKRARKKLLVIYRRAFSHIRRLKYYKNKLLKKVVKLAPRVKKFKKKFPYAKGALFTLSNFHLLAKVMSTVPSATGPGSAFLFEGFFSLLKKKNNRFIIPRKLIVSWLPDLLANLRFKIKCESSLKMSFRSSFSREFRKNLIGRVRKNERLPSLSAILHIAQILPAVREVEFLGEKNSAKMIIKRRKRRSYIYNRNILPPVAAFKKILIVLKCIKKIIRKKSRVKNHRFLKYLMRTHRRAAEALQERLTVDFFYSPFVYNVSSRSLKILRTNKHFYNLFSNIAAFVGKVKFQRKISLGPVADTAFNFRKFPLKKTVWPFLEPSCSRQVGNWSFLQLKELVQHSLKRFSTELIASRLEGFSRLFLKGALECLVAGRDPYFTELVSSLVANAPAFNKECGPLINDLSKSMMEKFPVLPYIDDVKEALSLDFLPFFDAKKTELDDSEYKLSLLFTNTSEFLKNREKTLNSVEFLNLKQLKHVTSAILSNFKQLESQLSDSNFYYSHLEGGRDYGALLLPSHLSIDMVGYKNVAFALLRELKFLIKVYYGDTSPDRKKPVEGRWVLFNRLINYLLPFYNGINTLKKLLSAPDKHFVKSIFPIVGLKSNYNSTFEFEKLFPLSLDFELSGQVANPRLRDFFNFFYINTLSVSINSYICPTAPSGVRLPSFLKSLARRYDSVIYHKNASFHLYEDFFSTKRAAHSKALVLPRFFLAERVESITRRFSDSQTFFESLAKLFFIVYQAMPDFHNSHVRSSDIRRYVVRESRFFNSIYFALEFIGDATAAELRKRSFDSYVFFSDWIDTVAANKVQFEESSVFLPPVPANEYVLKIINKSPLDELFFSLFFHGSSKIAKKKKYEKRARVRSLSNYIVHLFALDHRRYFAKFMIKLVFSSRFNSLSASNARKAPWLTSTSSPYSDVYMTSHIDILNALSRTFYAIFSIPIFVKYFPLPVFFSSSPELSKFASIALSEVSGRGIKMDAHSRDWYLEYLFVCYASLATKSAEGIVNFIIRILPYYKKWGDPISLFLSPIAAADLNKMGISTVRLSFRGRPGGVERARAVNYVYGEIKTPAMRKLFTTGSYCYKQCISKKNGGVTSVHLWIISRI